MAATFRSGVLAGNAVSGTEPSVSIAPAIGDLFIVFVAAKGNTATPVVTDNNGGTYTQIGTNAAYRTSLDTLTAWVRNQKLINTTATVVTAVIGAHTSVEILVHAYSGMSYVGAAAIRQSAITQNGTTTPTATFGAAALTGNPTGGAVGYDLSAATTCTPPVGWTEQQEAGQALGASLEGISRASGFTGTAITWSNNIGEPHAVIIFELDGTLASIGYVGDNHAKVGVEGTQHGDGMFRATGYAGSGINPIPNYVMAQWDSAGVRQPWLSFTPDATQRPTVGVTLPFIGDPIILGRIS
jgi:hypothetical protein